MKKTSFILILIFSVFFSYKIAFAEIYSQTDDSVRVVTNIVQTSGLDSFMTGVSGTDFYVSFPMDYNGGTQIYAFRITDINTGTTYYGISPSATTGAECYTTPGMTGNGGSTKFTNTLDTSTNVVYKAYPCGASLTFNPAHTYRLIIEEQTGGTDFAFYGSTSNLADDIAIYVDVTAPPPPPGTQGTYNEVPLNGAVVSTTGTGDVTVSFDYYLDDEQDPEHDTAQWCMRLTRTDTAGEAEFCDDVAFNTYTEVSHEFTGLPLDSQWEWNIIFTRPGFFIDEYSILHAGSNYFWAGRFTIDSTVQDIYEAYTTCSITDLAGCFQNAIVFLFYPSASSLNDFSNLYDAVKNKPPFGYISAVQTALQGINDTETGVFTLETMPILDTYIFTPMRTALIWIMWLAFIFMFYHRLKNIHL